MLCTIDDLNNIEDAREGIELAKELSFLYDEYTNSEDDDSHLRPAGIHPSESSGCLRQMTYSIQNYPKKMSINKFWRQRFKVGHVLHDMIQTDFEKLAARTHDAAHQLAKERNWVLEFEREVEIAPHLQKVAKELRMFGHSDGVFTFRETLGGPPILRVLLEGKTMSPPEYEKLTAPLAEHVWQVQLYMAALDIPLCWFFYFSKGTQNNTNSEGPWLVVFDPVLFAEIEKHCRHALSLADKKELGQREESVLCQFCPYAWHCEPRMLQWAVRNLQQRESLRTG